MLCLIGGGGGGGSETETAAAPPSVGSHTGGKQSDASFVFQDDEYVQIFVR